MKCYECCREGRERDAVALCHRCLAALCESHVFCIEDPVTANEPVSKLVELPLPARLFLCATCRAALRQVGNLGEISDLSELIASKPLTPQCTG